jgi:hypothetical protein
LRLKAIVVSIGLACISQNVAAQTCNATVGIAPGSRVRVKTATLVAPLVANFLEQRCDTLVFIEDGRGRGVWSFDMAQIDRLETTRGQVGRNKRAMQKGALIGGVIGLATGLIFASTFEPGGQTRRYSRMQTGIVAGLAGAGFGFFIGSLQTAEAWQTVPLPRQAPDFGAGFSFGIGRR